MEIKAFFLFFFSFLTCIGQKYTDLELKIDALAIENSFNGVVLVANGNKPIYFKAFGFSDLNNKTQLLLNDNFGIGSISKQITAVLILKAFEENKLNLNDKVGKHFKNIKQNWSDSVTIHHLLTHTHGISSIEKPLSFNLGSQFQYSQLGYDLLAQILEKVYNKSFRDISMAFFRKNQLGNTFHPYLKDQVNLVKGYEEDSSGKLIYMKNSFSGFAASGGFISNAKDLLRWNLLLHSGKLLKKNTLGLMKTPYATRIHPMFNELEYGYGLVFKKGEEEIEIGATGYVPGFASANYYYPKTGMSVIVLENTALNLDDLKKTFIVHTSIMKIIKEMSIN